MFKVLDKVCEPQRGTKYSSSVDLFARKNIVIRAREIKRIPLGVIIDFEKVKDIIGNDITTFYCDDEIDYFLKSHFLELKIRNSLSDNGLIIANGSGEINLDDPKEICLLVHYPLTLDSIFNYQKKKLYQINKGDKVAQIKLMEHKSYLMGYESDKIRKNSFGSIVKKDKKTIK